jgi:pantoate--beta-alanine ligase
MVIFKKANDLKDFIALQTAAGSKPGFVPTMGALHEGHKSLIEKAHKENDITVCSIFVNPTQFNDKKDLEKYPVSTGADIELLAGAGCDVLFLPSVEEIYPDGLSGGKIFGFGYLDSIFEGAQRPGHFRGVGQVVARLLEMVQPGKLYLGQKDYQQCMVLRKLKDVMGLAELEIVICPTMREADGLAMSSRNRRLTEPQRVVAATIYQCLISIESKQNDTAFDIVKKECTELLASKGFEPEYVAIADARDLSPLSGYQRPAVALIAAKIGDVRLIDNILLNV